MSTHQRQRTEDSLFETDTGDTHTSRGVFLAGLFFWGYRGLDTNCPAGLLTIGKPLLLQG